MAALALVGLQCNPHAAPSGGGEEAGAAFRQWQAYYTNPDLHVQRQPQKSVGARELVTIRHDVTADVYAAPDVPDPLTTVPARAELEILEHRGAPSDAAPAQWYRVRARGRIGWIHAKQTTGAIRTVDPD